MVATFENGEGPGKVSYANLKTLDVRGALHVAAGTGRKPICKYLIEKLNFNVDDIDINGETPLILAVKGGHRTTITVLVNNGADVTKSSNDGATPLHHAAATGPQDIIELLIYKGSDWHATSRLGMPLHYAAMHGNLKTLKFLLDLKANPNCISPMYTSPLLLAVGAESIECMELLLKKGADPNLQCSDYQQTPLCCAVIQQDKEMIRCLLNADADPNCTDFSGKTALESAAWNGFREVVELLFPVTSRIACYPDWSINGVMLHIRSKEANELLKSKMKELILQVKARGNKALRTVDAQAGQGGPTDAIVLSNRSLCYTLLKEGKLALADAKTCVRLVPGWAKAHYREDAALKVIKRYHEAAEAFYRALAPDLGNQEIEDAYWEALALAGTRMWTKKLSAE